MDINKILHERSMIEMKMLSCLSKMRQLGHQYFNFGSSEDNCNCRFCTGVPPSENLSFLTTLLNGIILEYIRGKFNKQILYYFEQNEDFCDNAIADYCPLDCFYIGGNNDPFDELRIEYEEWHSDDSDDEATDCENRSPGN